MRLILKSAWNDVKTLPPVSVGNEFINLKRQWDKQDNGSNPVDRINSQGSVTFPAKIVTAAYTLSDNDYLVMGNASSPFTVTLPDATTIMGRLYVVINTGTKALTVNTTNAQTINGGSSLVFPSKYYGAQFFSDGSNWVAL